MSVGKSSQFKLNHGGDQYNMLKATKVPADGRPSSKSFTCALLELKRCTRWILVTEICALKNDDCYHVGHGDHHYAIIIILLP